MKGKSFAMSWDRWASLYERMLVHVEQQVLSPLRHKYASMAKGSVLEVGAGTGLTLPHYSAGTRLTLVDVSERMLAEANKRVLRLGLEVELVQADLARLPFASEAFDMVLSFDLLCSLQSPRSSLREIARVLRGGGRAVFVEHGRTGNIPFDWLLTVMTCFSFMCAEKDPYKCNRFALISPLVEKRGIQVKHILEDGSLLSHVILEKQMLKEFYPEWDSPTLFEQPKSFEEAIMIAYERKFRKMTDS